MANTIKEVKLGAKTWKDIYAATGIAVTKDILIILGGYSLRGVSGLTIPTEDDNDGVFIPMSLTPPSWRVGAPGGSNSFFAFSLSSTTIYVQELETT